MKTVTSRDGTRIAYDTTGAGPALVLVDGALCHRAFGPAGPLAAQLASRFTVFTYDRRGRGDSGDTRPYAVDREIEDIGALIDAAGGTAFVYGISSGAALALEATSRLPNMVKKLALYEAPFVVDNSWPALPDDYVARLEQMIATDRRGDAVTTFMKTVGVPAFGIAMMRLMPAWRKLKKVAHTLPYDMTIVRDNQRGKPLTAKRWSSATVPTLVADGGKSPAWMRHGMRALAEALPNSKHRTVEGQTHMLNPKAIAPVLIEFFNGGNAGAGAA